MTCSGESISPSTNNLGERAHTLSKERNLQIHACLLQHALATISLSPHYATFRRLPVLRRWRGLLGFANVAILSNTRSPSFTASAVPKCRQSSGAMTTAWAPFGKRDACRPLVALSQSYRSKVSSGGIGLRCVEPFFIFSPLDRRGSSGADQPNAVQPLLIHNEENPDPG